jgi:hypothetical protein
MVRQRDRRHPEFNRALNQAIEIASTVGETEAGVHVQVNEWAGHSLSVPDGYKTPYPLKTIVSQVVCPTSGECSPDPGADSSTGIPPVAFDRPHLDDCVYAVGSRGPLEGSRTTSAGIPCNGHDLLAHLTKTGSLAILQIGSGEYPRAAEQFDDDRQASVL